MSLVPHELQRKIASLAPTHYDAPSGSRVPIRYDGETPVLAIRVQELFGLGRHPDDRRRRRALDARTAVAGAPADPDDARPAGFLARLMGGCALGHARPLPQACLAGRSARGARDQPRQAARQIALGGGRPAGAYLDPCRNSHVRPAGQQPAQAEHPDPAALAGHHRPERSRADRRLRSGFPAAGQPVLPADRRCGLAQRRARAALSGGTPAEAVCGARHLDVRRRAARRPALSDRRADQSVFGADDGSRRHLGDLAVDQAYRRFSAASS